MWEAFSGSVFDLQNMCFFVPPGGTERVCPYLACPHLPTLSFFSSFLGLKGGNLAVVNTLERPSNPKGINVLKKQAKLNKEKKNE